ncbi:MAG: EamA family transporter [Oenococcus sp.]|uniref:DMT family transporter n=1 Tax=Oenococcus TaxID=46254 RepID=UPI0021E99800|nr:EamA family transporter [Oenococcus kitaharae]MCV3297097.1 EamA family transporter [Oenococcus kitaharae]
MVNSRKRLGLFYAVLGPFLWGLNGVVTQYLFNQVGLDVNWVLSVRLFFAGLALFIYVLVFDRQNLFNLIKDRSVRWRLIIFMIFGDFMSQYSYIVAISESNAALATILTSLSPLFVIFFYVIVQRHLPQRIDSLSLIVALAGTFLLVTHGHIGHLQLSLAGLFWGLFAALVYAFGTIYPIKLVSKYGPLPVTALSLFVSGILFNCYRPFFEQVPKMSGINWFLLIFFTIVSTAFGTAMWFLSLHLVGATTMSLLSAVEPLTAAILSITLLHLSVQGIDVLGASLILLMMCLQAFKHQHVR